MAKFIFLLILSLLFVGFIPAEAEPFKLTLSMALAFIVGLYEVIIRIVPTAGQYAVIGKLIDILKWLSDFLNNKKK